MAFSVVLPQAGLAAAVGVDGVAGKAFTAIVMVFEVAVAEVTHPPATVISQVMPFPLARPVLV